MQSLPAPVKKRLKALKKIQLETTKLEAKFYEEVHQLECKYHQLYTPLYEKRAQITKGNPTPFPPPILSSLGQTYVFQIDFAPNSCGSEWSDY